MRLLDTAGGRGALASSLGGKLLAGSLATSGLASGLLGASHCRWCLVFEVMMEVMKKWLVVIGGGWKRGVGKEELLVGGGQEWFK